jgi:hypothetical protein
MIGKLSHPGKVESKIRINCFGMQDLAKFYKIIYLNPGNRFPSKSGRCRSKPRQETV